MLRKHLLISLVLLLGLWVLGGCGGGASFMPIEESLAADTGQLDGVIAVRNPSVDLPADEIVYMSDFKYGKENHLFSVYINEDTEQAELTDLGAFPSNGTYPKDGDQLPKGDNTFNAQIGTTADGTRVYCIDYWTGMIVYYDADPDSDDYQKFVVPDPKIYVKTSGNVLHVGEVTFGSPYEGNDWGDLFVSTTDNKVYRVDPDTGAAEDMGYIAYNGGNLNIQAGDLAFDDEENFYIITVGAQGGSPGKGIYLIDGWKAKGADGLWHLSCSLERLIDDGDQEPQYRGLAILDGGAGDWLGDKDTGADGPPDYIVRFGASDLYDKEYPMVLPNEEYFDHGAGGDMSVGRLGQEPCEPYETALIAGQNMTVGTVTVEPVDGQLWITYTITDSDWCIMETHLHVATKLDDIPQTKKYNPIPGQFDHQGEHNCETEVVYKLDPPGDGLWCTSPYLYIAAHAVVRKVYDGLNPTMYLAEIAPGQNVPTEIYKVSLFDNDSGADWYELEKIGELVVEYNEAMEPTEAFCSSHIAVSPDGMYIYGIDSSVVNAYGKKGHLAEYNITSGQTLDIGDLSTWGLADSTQLAFGPDECLYATSRSTSGAEAHKLWKITLGKNELDETIIVNVVNMGRMFTDEANTKYVGIEGADIVFRDDGYLYVLTNIGGVGTVAGLYQVDYSGSVLKAKLLNSGGGFTGLADTFDGAGDLIASRTMSTYFRVFSGLDFQTENDYLMKYKGTDTTYHHDYGDMTSLPVPAYTYETAWGYGPEFDGKNWATYIEWEVCCNE